MQQENRNEKQGVKSMINWLTDWGLMALSAQIGYRAFDKYFAVKKVKLMREVTMLRCWEYIQINH